jgi:hypothetical protein
MPIVCMWAWQALIHIENHIYHVNSVGALNECKRDKEGIMGYIWACPVFADELPRFSINKMSNDLFSSNGAELSLKRHSMATIFCRESRPGS